MAILLWPARPSAHDIPGDVLVQAFVKPEGQSLQLLVRMPLVAMRDVQFPTRGPGFLDLARAEAALRNAAMLWIASSVSVLEGDVELGPPRLVAVRVSPPSDTSFASFEQARAYVTGAPLSSDVDLMWNQALFDVLLEYPIESARSDFSIHPGFARLGLRVVTVLRFLPPGGAVRAFQFHGDPGLVRLDPRWHQAALQFVRLGFEHILSGVDHLLFLFCLVIPFRRPGQLVLIVTAFTVAHSITLISSALGFGPGALWFPPLIETLIATSIVYMALENIVLGATQGGRAASLRRRWIITFAFGLVHGFGFSFALQETLQFAGSHLVTSLLAFNVGVELGQLLVLAVLLPILYVAFRVIVEERIGIIIASALAAHTAWHWMTERWHTLRQFDVPPPDAGTMASALRWLIALLVIAGLWWLVTSARHKQDNA